MLTSIALLAAAFFPVQDATEPQLLSDTPAGWKFERLDLPLSFAPDLDYEGFEELSFAPGMFDPESETYFSYVMALRLEGDVRLDRGAVDGFLEEYYRGLCGAVAEGRQLDLDLDKVSAEVRRVGDDYHASVEMFDAFVTGEPMTLEFELSVHPEPQATVLFGLASPMPKAGAAWKALGEIRETWKAGRPVPVFLNHLFVVPDAETYAAIRDSEFLSGIFAVGEERTTVRQDMTYTGTYFYGARTYFEFLKPDDATQFSEGGCGIAFGVERVGGLAECAESLKKREVQTFAGPINRKFEEAYVPWFKMMGIAMPASPLNLFSLEYEPTFLAQWHPGESTIGVGIRRQDVLARYRGVLRERLSPMFEDVVEVYLELGEEERARFYEVCESFGYLRSDGDATVIHAPEVRFVVRNSDGPGRITGFRMKLSEPVEREELSFGKARLVFQGDTATFFF